MAETGSASLQSSSSSNIGKIEETIKKIGVADKEKGVASDEVQLTIFHIGTEEFGVDINSVTEIIKYSDVTRVPNANETIEGVINLRGRICVVLNLAKKLGFLPMNHDDNTRIIMIECENGKIGVIVDSVAEVMMIKKSSIQKAPEIISKKVKGDYISGVSVINNRIIIILDVKKIFEA